MKLPFLLFLLFTTTVPCSRLLAEIPHPKVIAIESAMRTWQERRVMTTGSTIQWPRRSDGTAATPFPEDCFYGDDLNSPPRAALLVNALRDDMLAAATTFVRNGDFSEPDGLDRLASALGPIPRAESANYISVFKQLAAALTAYPNIVVPAAKLVRGPDFTSGLVSLQPIALAGLDWGDALGATVAAFNQAKHPLGELEIPGVDGRLTTNITLLPTGDGTSPGIIFFASTFGRFSFDGSRYTGRATLYAHETRSAITLPAPPPPAGPPGPPAPPAPPAPPVPPFSGITTEKVILGAGVWLSRQYGYDGLPPGVAPAAGFASASIAPHIVISPTYRQEIDEPTHDCISCSTCSACEPGSADFELHSVEVQFGLGNAVDGPAGSLHIQSDLPAPDLATPAALKPSIRRGAWIVRDPSTQLLRQVVSPQSIVDIVVLDPYSYEIRFYSGSPAAGPSDGELLTPIGAPYQTYGIENPDRSATVFNRLRISATGETTSESLYEYEAATRTWLLTREQDGIAWTESRRSADGDQPGRRVEQHDIRDAAGHVVFRERNTYATFPWNLGPEAANPEELIESILDPDGAALRTAYEFNSDGRLRRQTESTGFWREYTYDDTGRITRTVSPFLNAPLGAATSVREEGITRSDNAPQETRIQSVVGFDGVRRETGRRYVVLEADKVIQIEATRAGAAWDAADNLVATTESVSAGNFAGRIAREVRPDQTATTYSYALGASGDLTTIVESGAFDPATGSVIDGTRTTTTRSSSGALLFSEERDIESALVLASSSAVERDDLGRVTRTVFDDGTTELSAYTCCGLGISTNREGTNTTYTYASGRLASESFSGLTFRYAYDAAGRRVAVTRGGTDGSTIVLESSEYDPAGRRTALMTPTGRTLTDYAREADATTIVTTTFADGGTEIVRTAPDGSPLSTSGTAVPPRRFEYGVDPRGAFRDSINVGSAGEQSERVREYFDAAGRFTARIYADGAEERAEYNALGQVAKQIDADGVTTIFAYNRRGEPEFSAVDLNRNGTIEFSGSDRITRTHRDVVLVSNKVFRRATESAWLQDGVDAETVLSTEWVTPSGRESIVTTAGLTTRTVVGLDGGGLRTETTTSPDGTTTIRRSVDGRMTDNEVSHPAIGVLAKSTYGYDAHGRLASATDLRIATTRFSYHPDDSLASTANGDPAQTTQFEYDPRGRLIRTTHPDGGVTTNTFLPTGELKSTGGAQTFPEEYRYDSQGRIVSLVATQTTWAYDPRRGWLTAKTDAAGRGPVFSYSAAGRLTRRQWARGVVTEYSYNAAGDLARIRHSDATPAVDFTYDRLGRLVSTTDAAGACAWEYGVAGELRAETYSGSGLLAGLSLARGFDSLGRMQSLLSTAALPVSYGYDSASRLTDISRGRASVHYEFAGLSAVSHQAATFDGWPRLETTHRYDGSGQLESLATSLNGTAYLGAVHQYNAIRQRTRTDESHGTYWTYAYDLLGQLTRAAKSFADGTPVHGLDLGYSYDAAGNRRSATRGATILIGGAREDYSANALNQYPTRTVPGRVEVAGSADPSALVSVGSTRALRQGDLFFRTVDLNNDHQPVAAAIDVTAVNPGAGPGGTDIVATANATAVVTGTPEAFDYDVDGNLLSDGRWTYAWNAENQLIRMESQTEISSLLPALPRQRLDFAYDAQGRRIQKRVSSLNSSGAWVLQKDLRFQYDGWRLIAEFDGTRAPLALTASYVWGSDAGLPAVGSAEAGGLILADVPSATGASETYFVASDSSGNVSALVGASTGTLAAEYDFDPFGQRLKHTGIAIPFQFSTQYTDEETSLVNFGLRYYSPSLGRWLTRDPLGESEGANLYRFVSNTPTNRHDILGLYEEAGHFWTSYVVAEAAGYAPDDAFRFAYFTQLPDELPQFDAVQAGKYFGSFSNFGGGPISEFLRANPIQDYGKKVQDLLHSLHGGNARAVEARRRCLGNLLSEKNLEPWQAGFLSHALGDAYAHTKLDSRGIENAYGYPLGHGLDSAAGRDPDRIASDIPKYRNYVSALFTSLSTGYSDPDKITALLRAVPRIPMNSSAANRFMLRWVATNTSYSKNHHHGYDPNGGRKTLDDAALRPPSALALERWFEKLDSKCCAN